MTKMIISLAVAALFINSVTAGDTYCSSRLDCANLTKNADGTSQQCIYRKADALDKYDLSFVCGTPSSTYLSTGNLTAAQVCLNYTKPAYCSPKVPKSD